MIAATEGGADRCSVALDEFVEVFDLFVGRNG
jgi:hypothetical protein